MPFDDSTVKCPACEALITVSPGDEGGPCGECGAPLTWDYDPCEDEWGGEWYSAHSVSSVAPSKSLDDVARIADDAL